MKKVVIGICITVFFAFLIVLGIGYYTRRNENPIPREARSKEKIIESTIDSYQALFDEIKNVSTVKLGQAVLVEGDGPAAPGGVCFPVEVNEKLLGYFSELHLWKSQLLGYFCDIDRTVSPYPETDFFGYPESDFTLIDLATGEKKKLEPLDWSFLSNPDFCGPFMAYWGTQSNDKAESIEDTKVLIYIYDWETNQVIAFKELTPRVVATDWPEFFEKPSWSADCGTATFRDNEVKHTLSKSNSENK